MNQRIINKLKTHFPNVQAIYLFGSRATDEHRNDSDYDIAILLPPREASQTGRLTLSEAHTALENLLNGNVDLINLRQSSTILQKEIIQQKRIYCRDKYAANEFEMLTLSYYGKLNEERREIINNAIETGRIY